jgi:hypothetical protein
MRLHCTSLKNHGKKGNQIVPIWLYYIQGRDGLATFPSLSAKSLGYAIRIGFCMSVDINFL